MAKTITKIQHDDTNNVDIRINKKESIIKEFSMVGRFNTVYSKRRNPRNIDVVDLMATLTPTANNLLKEIKDNYYYRTNEVTLEKPKGKYKQKRRSAAANALKRHKAIKKTGQRTYIINPYLFIPKPEDEEDILAKWNSLP